MAKNFNFTGLVGTSNEPAEKKPEYVTLTPSTIRLGHGSEIFQLCNITKVGKYKVKSNKFILFLGIIVLGLPGLKLFFGALFSGGRSDGGPMGFILLAVAIFLLWLFLKPGAFAFGFECCSGSARYLSTTDEKFIDKMIFVVSEYMEKKQQVGTVINVNNRTIKNCTLSGGANLGDGNVYNKQNR